jgi:hypothetical protein
MQSYRLAGCKLDACFKYKHLTCKYHSDVFQIAKTLLRLCLKIALFNIIAKTLLRLKSTIFNFRLFQVQITKTLLRLYLKISQDHAEV